MGIQGLLPFVKKACREGDISEFAGHSIAIDVSCLLHKGIYACADKVVTGQDTQGHINYVKKHVDALLALKCHVILVFDGRPLKAKEQTNNGRSEQRKSNLAAAKVLMAKGNKKEAFAKLQRAASITGKVIESTIEAFRKYVNVDVIVSPYESDAQLAFLTREKFADAVVTEDSDLIVFGCERIIFKWAVSAKPLSNVSTCTIYEKAKLPSCFLGISHQLASNFNFDKFRRICILSGCDYLQGGLPNIGLNKATTFFTKVNDTDLKAAFKRISTVLNKPYSVSETFVYDFIKAEKTFAHQVIYDPRARCQRPLNPYPPAGVLNQALSQPIGQVATQADDPLFISQPHAAPSNEFAFAGEVLSALLSTRLALGNDIKKSAVQDKFFLPKQIPAWSIWSEDFVSGIERLKKGLEAEKRDATQLGAFALDPPDSVRVVKKRPRILIDPIDGEEVESPKVDSKKSFFAEAFTVSSSSPSSSNGITARPATQNKVGSILAHFEVLRSPPSKVSRLSAEKSEKVDVVPKTPKTPPENINSEEVIIL